MRYTSILVLVLAFCGSLASAQTAGAPESKVAKPSLVVIVTRHGIRSPTDPDELRPYVAYAMPSWNVAPGFLTANGATMMSRFGASYRAYYAAQGLLPASGCPSLQSVYVWADVDERTKATGAALLEGLAPHCAFAEHDGGGTVDPMFHALPTLGSADPATSLASVAGYAGADPKAVVRAYGLAFAKIDAILGCDGTTCQRVSAIPTVSKISAKTGLPGNEGAVDLASTAVEDFILAYADGKPLSQIGNGAVDRKTLLEISQLHTLKFALDAETPYVARVQGSNLLSHVLATIDQGATGVTNTKTRAPLGAKFVAFVGHDTNLAELSGMLRLHWLLSGYQENDTPPGGALVFELYRGATPAETFVRTFFTAQSLDQMRTLSSEAPARVPVFVPGCPALDCPIDTFDRIAGAAIDPAFTGSW